jgi:hypothetical protein
MTTTVNTKTRTAKKGLLGSEGTTGPLVCRSCGVVVRNPDPTRTETLTIYGPGNGRGAPGASTRLSVTRCDVCFERRERAEAVMAEHPRVRREHASVGVDRLDAAFAAVDVIQFKGARLTAGYVGTDARLRDFIDTFAGIGAAATWSARPVASDAAGRWAHATPELLREINFELKAFVLRGLERPFPFSPPTSAGELPGCGFCGIGTLTVRESEAKAAWGPILHIPPSLVGGAGPNSVPAHLCPDCRTDLLKAGNAVGMPAVERALLRFKGYEALTGWGVQLPGIRAFAALRVGTAPNVTRWQHIGPTHLARLDADLAVSPYVRKRTATR